MIAILHTWGQTLTHHHAHFVVPSGGLTADGRWIGCRPNFFLPVHAPSRLYRRLSLERLKAAHEAGQLRFFGHLARLAEPAMFARYLKPVANVD
jgi:Putative transposase